MVPAGALTPPPSEDTFPPRVALDGGVAAEGMGGGVGLSSISSSEERGGVGVSPATPCVTWGGEGLLGLAVTVAVLATEEGVASLSSLFILMRSVEKMVENLEEGKDDDEMLEEITLEIRSKVFSADGEKMGYIYVGTGHWVCL